ncbi:TDRD5 protein, partial [Odontophorus gujanensis]|nr:TDRD5 protein [Odontophorus gujanensis]
MSQQVQLMEVLKKEVRSQLLAAKDGLTPAQLEQEYLAMVGRPLPLRDLGFVSTMELVASMPGVVQVCPNGKGGFLLKAVVDETTKGLAKLISRQKTSGKTQSAARKERASLSQDQHSFSPKGKAGVLPAAVKRELQDLLSSSPLLLLDFNDAYYTRFKRTFQYTQYGFFSMLEVFESMSDVITVKQTGQGSLITLKSSSNDIEQKKMPQVLTAELPPLEPTCETQIFHQAAEEKSEPVDTRAVGLDNGLKEGRMKEGRMDAPNTGKVLIQQQDLEQSWLEKLMVTPEIPPDAVQDRRLCSLSPLERKCLVGVTVNVVVSPSEFYIHVCSAETSDKLWDMMVEMRRCYSNKFVSDRYIMPESSVQPGQLCCVMFSRWWYRVVIHRVINDQEVEVFYPDYGNIGIVQKSWLRFLKWCYLKLPAQAIPCSLAWVKPMEGTWTSEATLQFQELCCSKILVGIVDEYVNGILHLLLCDTSSEKDVYVHSVLRDKGYADICKENLPSQGFKELNPSALYVQPSAKQDSTELVEPDLCLQQDSLCADNEGSSARLDRDELCNQMDNLYTKEKRDDVQPLPDEVNEPKTADQDPESAREGTNKSFTDLMAVAKTPHPLDESRPVIFFKPLENYFSFLCANQPAETSQDGFNKIEGFSNKAQTSEVLHPSVLLMAAPFMPNNCNGDEKMKNRDLPENRALAQSSASVLAEQEMSWKLYVPPTTLSAVLAAPARLATSHGYFHWLPGLRKEL